MGKKATKEKNQDSRIMSVAEAASYMRVCENTVRNLINRGDLSAFKIGRVLRTSSTMCDEYMRKQSKRMEIKCKIKNG